MKNFFKVLIVFLLWTQAAPCETLQAENKSADAPAPPASVHISVPHSERTKGNFMDIALDFLFSRFFKMYKDFDITYDFFEINTERDLVFTNFKVKSLRSDVAGTVVAQKVVFDFSDFMNALKSQRASTSKIGLEKVSGNLKIGRPVKGGKVFRDAKFKADQVTLKDVVLAVWAKGSSPDKLAEEISGKNVSVTITNPSEKYAASSVEVKGLKPPHGKIKSLTFSSATVDGREYTDVLSFLKAVRQ